MDNSVYERMCHVFFFFFKPAAFQLLSRAHNAQKSYYGPCKTNGNESGRQFQRFYCKKTLVGYWQSRTDCCQTKQKFPTIFKRISFELLQKGRKEFSEAVQLITGHNFLQRHKVIVQKDIDPLCRSCGEDEETSHHVVAECPAFAAIRLRVLGTPVLQGTLHWSTQIAEFLREINFSSLQDQGVE